MTGTSPTVVRRVPSQQHRARGRERAAVAAGATALAVVLAIHGEVFPMPVHVFLRGWGLHSCALLFAVIGTTMMLGYFRSESARQRRTLLWIGCACPLAITLLHELGQWIWPPGPRDPFDSARDALLNVIGGAVGCWLLRRAAPITVPAAAPGDSGTRPTALRR